MENKKKFIVNFVYFAIVIAICYLVYRYALQYALPFIYGGLIAMLFNKPIAYLTKKGAHRSIASLVILLGFYAVILVLTALIGIKIVTDIIDLVVTLPDLYNNNIAPYLRESIDNIQNTIKNLDPKVMETIQSSLNSFYSSIGDLISNGSVKLVTILTNVIKQAPASIVKVIMTIVSSVYFSVDYENIRDFILRQMSPKVQKILNESLNYIKKTIVECLKSYGSIMGLTFIELTIGLIFTLKNHIVLVAALIAVVDILPVLGCGTVLIPWSIISFITQEYAMGIKLAVIYVIIYIIRQIIEPKIVGDSMGLHPILSLASIFIGAQILGGIGIFAGPILASLVVHLNGEGYIKLFR